MKHILFAISAGVGIFAQTPGADVHYVPTPDAVVSAMLDLARVAPADVVYDLGSGDGRIVVEAARKYGACAVGVELDPVVTLFLSPNINARLQPKLRRELKPGARIVSHRFPMPPDWKPDRDLAVKGTHVFLWTIR